MPSLPMLALVTFSKVKGGQNSRLAGYSEDKQNIAEPSCFLVSWICSAWISSLGCSGQCSSVLSEKGPCAPHKADRCTHTCVYPGRQGSV